MPIAPSWIVSFFLDKHYIPQSKLGSIIVD